MRSWLSDRQKQTLMSSWLASRAAPWRVTGSAMKSRMQKHVKSRTWWSVRMEHMERLQSRMQQHRQTTPGEPCSAFWTCWRHLERLLELLVSRHLSSLHRLALSRVAHVVQLRPLRQRRLLGPLHPRKLPRPRRSGHALRSSSPHRGRISYWMSILQGVDCLTKGIACVQPV